MPSDIRIAGRSFRPGWIPSLVAAAFIALSVALGNWQTRRAEEKLEAGRMLDEAARGPVLQVPADRVDAAGFERRRVSARGTFVARATLYLDNKVIHGAAGYQVVTPLGLEGGGTYILVNRGWIAAGDRSRLPEAPAPEGVQTVEGVAVVPGTRFLELAPEADSGKLRQNLVLSREEKRLGLSLQPFVIEQTSEGQDGLVRAWERPDSGVDRHRGYALQWYSFAALAAVFYVAFAFKRIGSTPNR
ncbi:MAG TPA: SURF1 family protein [Burkholderiales bacterium]|nr:SURF1 family protein [Burkholderiales bacterium]